MKTSIRLLALGILVGSLLNPSEGRAALGPLYRQMFVDAQSIVRDDNSCSRFFGGPERATAVLKMLIPRFKGRYWSSNTAQIKMGGTWETVTDTSVGFNYRIFEKNYVNLDEAAWSVRRRLGRFKADTRPGKALAVLHEVGHLIRRDDGQWLLPDDGGNLLRSEKNTELVEGRCVEQLYALGFSY